MPHRTREPYLIRHHHKYKQGTVTIRRMITLPEELNQALARIGDEKHTSANSLIVTALEVWVRWWEDSTK
jgi:hypothetical protein